MLAIKWIFNHSARKPPYKMNYTSLDTKIIFHSNWQIFLNYFQSNGLKPVLFNSLQYFIVVALVFQLQLHERGMKIHEIIYEQVNALLLCTETCFCLLLFKVLPVMFPATFQYTFLWVCRSAGCCQMTMSRSVLQQCRWFGYSATCTQKGKDKIHGPQYRLHDRLILWLMH